MTKPIEYDYFPIELRDTTSRFFAVLTETVLLETGDENIDREYKRGIYIFSTVRARNVFTNCCNDAKDKRIAYRYNRKP